MRTSKSRGAKLWHCLQSVSVLSTQPISSTHRTKLVWDDAFSNKPHPIRDASSPPFYQHGPGPGGWEGSELQGPQEVCLLETQAGQSRGAAFQNRFCSSSNRSEPTNDASLQESAPRVPTPGEHPQTADGEKASVVVILAFPHHSNE